MDQAPLQLPGHETLCLCKLPEFEPARFGVNEPALVECVGADAYQQAYARGETAGVSFASGYVPLGLLPVTLSGLGLCADQAQALACLLRAVDTKLDAQPSADWRLARDLLLRMQAELVAADDETPPEHDDDDQQEELTNRALSKRLRRMEKQLAEERERGEVYRHDTAFLINQLRDFATIQLIEIDKLWECNETLRRALQQLVDGTGKKRRHKQQQPPHDTRRKMRATERGPISTRAQVVPHEPESIKT